MLFIAFAVRLDRDIVNSEAEIDTGNLKPLVLGGLLALIRIIAGTVTLRIVLNRLNNGQVAVCEKIWLITLPQKPTQLLVVS